ncbi:MAG: PKD domain-containing protein, partial [candidate division Zixibacteria bacterium]|nr:PKD domain-containing protein [candidate division Zixibacteria bacterium]
DEWFWDFGDGETTDSSWWVETEGGDSTLQSNPEHTYDNTGIFEVSLTVRDSSTGSEDTEVQKRFIIVGTSISGFTAEPNPACTGDSITFTPSEYGDISSWEWRFGDNSSSTDSNPIKFYDSLGIYSCTLFVQGTCGQDTLIADSLILINDCPDVIIHADTHEGCAPLEVQFYDSTDWTIQSRLWDFSNGDTSIVQNPTAEFNTAGTYEITLTLTGADSISFTGYDTVVVIDSVMAGFEATTITEACMSSFQRFQVSFQDISTGSIDSLVWHFGDGYLAYNDSVTVHEYVDPGIYSCTLEAIGLCRTDTAIIEDLIKLSDTLVDNSAGFIVEPGDGALEYKFTDTSKGIILSRLWVFGDGEQDNTYTDSVVLHTYPATGKYNVTLEIDNSCDYSVQYSDSVEINE